jgi:hypothetical protein
MTIHWNNINNNLLYYSAKNNGKTFSKHFTSYKTRRQIIKTKALEEHVLMVPLVFHVIQQQCLDLRI